MTGKIFLSYRREDTAWFAQALFGKLEKSFPVGSLFMDVEGGIGDGQDFVRVIEEQVSACDVMLVLIGPGWLTVTDETGQRRLRGCPRGERCCSAWALRPARQLAHLELIGLSRSSHRHERGREESPP